MRQPWEPASGCNARGFEYVAFEDAYGELCSVQASSGIGEYEDGLDPWETPGSSALWVGAVRTSTGTGLPQRMHLSREQVAGLVEVFTRWLADGHLTPESMALHAAGPPVTTDVQGTVTE